MGYDPLVNADELGGKPPSAYGAPETTQSAMVSGGYQLTGEGPISDGDASTGWGATDVGTSVYTFSEPLDCDGARIHLSWEDAADIDAIRVLSGGSVVASASEPAQGWLEFVWAYQTVTSVEIDVSSDGGYTDPLNSWINEFQPHVPNTAPHVHDL
jgi:hypothetical protein